MDERSKKEMNDYYSGLLEKYGPTKESLVYSDEEQQIKRYGLLAAVEPMSKDSSILDVGCGLGHFCDFMRWYGWKGQYTGIDINQDMIREAKARLPHDTFLCVDMLRDRFNHIYDYVFCGATIEHKPKFGDPTEYLYGMIKKMFACAKKAVAFDVFSAKADFFNENNLYIEPTALLEFCYTLTKRVVLRNDSRPYEIAMYLYKGTSKNAFNIYRDWILPEPKII